MVFRPGSQPFDDDLVPSFSVKDLSEPIFVKINHHREAKASQFLTEAVACRGSFNRWSAAIIVPNKAVQVQEKELAHILKDCLLFSNALVPLNGVCRVRIFNILLRILTRPRRADEILRQNTKGFQGELTEPLSAEETKAPPPEGGGFGEIFAPLDKSDGRCRQIERASTDAAMLVSAANRPAKRGIRGIFSIDAVPPHSMRGHRHPSGLLAFYDVLVSQL